MGVLQGICFEYLGKKNDKFTTLPLYTYQKILRILVAYDSSILTWNK